MSIGTSTVCTFFTITSGDEYLQIVLPNVNGVLSRQAKYAHGHLHHIKTAHIDPFSEDKMTILELCDGLGWSDLLFIAVAMITSHLLTLTVYSNTANNFMMSSNSGVQNYSYILRIYESLKMSNQLQRCHFKVSLKIGAKRNNRIKASTFIHQFVHCLTSL